MNRNLLVISVAAAVVAAGGAAATTMHKKHMMNDAGRYAAPSQPIPYAQLDSYLKGSRSDREKIESHTATVDTQTAQAGVTNPPMSSDTGAQPAGASPTGATPDTGAAPTGAMANPTQNPPTDNTGSAAAPQSGSGPMPPTGGDTATGAPMSGPATPSASPNTPQ